MKLNDYVRTKDGVIGKVTKEQPFMNDILIFLDNKQGNITYQSKDGVFKVNHKEDIIKSSPNIIDLIEAGDYVNGEKVIRLFNPTFLSMGELPYVITDKNKYEPQEIENVVTKQQFSQMEYKVGE
jgi:hypothetical protein